MKRNIIKILCLTVGLAMGFLLVAKVYFEQTFDTFFPEADRIYMITESVVIDGEYQEYNQVPGAIAPGLKQYVPQVETATRTVYLGGISEIRLDDGRSFSVDCVKLADSAFFDVFKTEIIAGNPHEILETVDMCMIPRSLAEKIGGNVVGQRICAPSLSESYKITVGGIYEDFPLNSTIRNDIYASMAIMPRFGPDVRNNWLGSDRFMGYVSLAPHTSPDDMKPGIKKMLEDNVEPEAIELYHFNIGVKPLCGLHSAGKGVRTMVFMLSLLALILLMSSGLNYLLVVIGQMSRRSKEMAVRKCYGTSNSRIFGRILAESSFCLLLSAGLAVLVIFCFSDLCHRLLGATPQQLLSTGKVWLVEGAVCMVILVITGVVPAWMFCRTPVAEAFRVNVRSRRRWKLTLLAVQFFASAVVAGLLVTVVRQYRLMSDTDMGFDYENIGMLYLGGVPSEARPAIVSELKRLGCVEGVASADMDFIEGASGNNVCIDNDWTNYINVADLYCANAEIFDVLGLEFVQGGPFTVQTDSLSRQVIVEERFIDVLKKLSGKEYGNIIGETFSITEHMRPDGSQDYTICGVIRNMHRGGFLSDNTDKRAAVLFPGARISNHLYVRFTHLTPAALAQAQEATDRVYPTRRIYITPYRTEVETLISPVKTFGTSVSIAGLAIIVIALIGLVGYTTDEVQRRSKEIAIRKVTGTPSAKIVRLFCADILKVALPSVLAGGTVAVIAGRRWLSQFSEQSQLSIVGIALCCMLMIALLVAVVAANSLRVARSNPVDHLRSE